MMGLTAFFGIGLLAFQGPQQQQRNLKVLPQNISRDSLDHLMDEYKIDLGVKCGYCHAQGSKASDANPKKDIARTMMRMTDDMNHKYMALVPHSDTAQVQTVTCYTCHRGLPKPVLK